MPHETNHFLRVVYNPNFQYYEFFVNRNVWIEIYYTENIPLHWGAFDTIIPVGAGTSKIGGRITQEGLFGWLKFVKGI